MALVTHKPQASVSLKIIPQTISELLAKLNKTKKQVSRDVIHVSVP